MNLENGGAVTVRLGVGGDGHYSDGRAARPVLDDDLFFF